MALRLLNLLSLSLYLFGIRFLLIKLGEGFREIFDFEDIIIILTVKELLKLIFLVLERDHIELIIILIIVLLNHV